MPDDVKNALREFVLFAQTLRGDEKSEAQMFLDRFFRALGHEGAIEAGATFEFRVAESNFMTVVRCTPVIRVTARCELPSTSAATTRFCSSVVNLFMSFHNSQQCLSCQA